MINLQKKIERLEKDNEEMLNNLKMDFADFRNIKMYIEAYAKGGEAFYIEDAKNTCKTAMSDIKHYTRRKIK